MSSPIIPAKHDQNQMPVANKPPLEFTVALVGQPNVGKSVVMNLLTGAGVMVSNYSGTTVEITKGHLLSSAGKINVIDTPGTYSLHSDTAEQKVTQRVLLKENVNLIINITDARNLSRNLYLTLQLLDLNIPMILVLNQMDMAKEAGLHINITKLEQLLQIPVLSMIAPKAIGFDKLKRLIINAAFKPGTALGKSGKPITFSKPIEKTIKLLQNHIEKIVSEDVGGERRSHPTRALAIHLLEHDTLDQDLFRAYPQILALVKRMRVKSIDDQSLMPKCYGGYMFCPTSDCAQPIMPTCLERTQKAREICKSVSKQIRVTGPDTVRLRIEKILDLPPTGIPILILIGYLAIRATLWVLNLAEDLVPSILAPVVRLFERSALLFAEGSFGRIIISSVPEGILLPFEVVMPTMFSIYLIMALLEDSGLMARIAVMMDRAMAILMLPGQAIIPIMLGFGCRAPGVLATRTLPEKASRIVVSTLLAIPIPCAATLGIITGVGKVFNANLGIIYTSIAVVFILIAWLAGQYLQSGQELILEVPPVRIPSGKAVAIKVWMRLGSFFTQVLPVLMLTGIGVKILLNTGILSGLSKLDPLSTKFLGITGQSLAAVAVTVVQRYAAPMVLLNLSLSAREATIAASMVSLSMPCLPVAFLIAKEFNWKILISIFVLALLTTIGVGATLNYLLPTA